MRTRQLTCNGKGRVRFIEDVSPDDVATIEAAVAILDATPELAGLASQYMESQHFERLCGSAEQYIQSSIFTMSEIISTLSEEPPDRENALLFLKTMGQTLKVFMDTGLENPSE